MSYTDKELERKNLIKTQMIDIWKITDIDFMGFIKSYNNIYTYHHLRVPKRLHGKISIYNGAILLGNSSHPYLHLIETFNRDMFLYLTEILIEVNEQEYLPISSQLIRINSALESFEKEHSSTKNNKGNYIIKESYTRRLKK